MKSDADNKRAKARRTLAFVLIIIFSISFIVHYGAIIALSAFGLTETITILSELFNVWLPIVSGFVGGAVTYYFTEPGTNEV